MNPNQGVGQDEQNSQFLGEYSALLGQDGENLEISVEDYEVESPNQELHFPDSFEPSDSIGMTQDNQGVAGTIQHGAPQGSSDELNALIGAQLQSWGFGNQSVAGIENPGSSDELNTLIGSHLESWGFGNQFVAGTENPAPGAFEAAYNEIQTLSSHDKELKEQQCNQLLAETLEMLQPLTTQLGPPGASNFIDQFSPLPASGTQLLENQMLAGTQLLIQQQFGQAAEEVPLWRLRKRAYDRAYRGREGEKKQKLMDEKQALGVANQLKDQLLEAVRAEKQKLQEQQQLLQAKQTKIEAEKEYWKGKYLLLNERYENSLREERRLRQKMQAIKIQIGEETEQVIMAKTAEETKNDN